MEKRWSIKGKADESIVNKLASELGIDFVLADLLAQRGIKTYDEAKKICKQRLVQIDGRVRTDFLFPAGFMGLFLFKYEYFFYKIFCFSIRCYYS